MWRGTVGAQESDGSQKDWCGGGSVSLVAFGRFCGASAAVVRVAFGRERSQAARPLARLRLRTRNWSPARVTM